MSAADRKGLRITGLALLVAALALLVLVYLGWQESEDAATGPGALTEETSPSPPAPTQGAADDNPPEPATGTPPSEDLSGAGETPTDPQTHEVLAEMREVWECYTAADCSLGQESDPRAEYFEADRRLAAGMRTLIAQHRANRISDPELADAVHVALQYESGRARAAAIEALGELPPAEEHLDALVATLDQHHDEKLFELALPELQRYAEQGRHEQVDAFLQSNLRAGAHFPARTIARELGPFLTPQNVADYRKLAAELPQDSRRAELLRETLDAYQGAD